MACNQKKQGNDCGCTFNVKNVGLCDLNKIVLNGSQANTLNWSEISVPEVLSVPAKKPDIEDIDQVYVTTDINSVKLIETPFAYNSYPIVADPALVTDIQTIVTDLTTSLNVAGDIAVATTTLTNAITALSAGITAVVTPISPQAATIITDLYADINTSIANAIAAVSVANAALDTVLTTPPVVLPTLTVSVDALKAAINNLLAVLGSINVTTPTILLQIEAALVAGGIPAATITTIMAAISTLLITTTPTLVTDLATAVTGLTTLVTGVLNSLLALILPTQTMAFKIIKNAEGTILTGRKLVIDGSLEQKIVYTALVDVQSVHSASYEVPFSAFIIPYANFEGLVYEENIPVVIPPSTTPTTINGYRYDPSIGIIVNLYEEFNVDVCIEDIYVYALDSRTIFKNITLFLQGKVFNSCS